MTTCRTCGKAYDEQKVAHVPILVEETRGAMTLKYASGCNEMSLVKAEDAAEGGE